MVEPQLAAYAERMVTSGKAPSVSAVFNDALAEHIRRERRTRRWWAAKVAEAAADPETVARVDRMTAHVDAQLRQFEQKHAGW